MTQLRRDTIALLEQTPEDKLIYIFQILEGIKGLSETDDSEKRKEAFEQLELMRKHSEIDYDEELAEYRDKRYGNENIS